jgi:hypothetical protein
MLRLPMPSSLGLSLRAQAQHGRRRSRSCRIKRGLFVPFQAQARDLLDLSIPPWARNFFQLSFLGRNLRSDATSKGLNGPLATDPTN